MMQGRCWCTVAPTHPCRTHAPPSSACLWQASARWALVARPLVARGRTSSGHCRRPRSRPLRPGPSRCARRPQTGPPRGSRQWRRPPGRSPWRTRSTRGPTGSRIDCGGWVVACTRGGAVWRGCLPVATRVVECTRPLALVGIVVAAAAPHPLHSQMGSGGNTDKSITWARSLGWRLPGLPARCSTRAEPSVPPTGCPS